MAPPIYDQDGVAAARAGGFNTLREPFPDPFWDYASQVMPASVRQAIRWCQHVVTSNNTYGQALRRVASYFITDVEINDAKADPEETQKYEEYLVESLGIKAETLTGLLNYLIYGNGFLSVLQPFRRALACPKGCIEMPLAKVFNTQSMNFTWANCEFTATCPRCGYHGPFEHIDRQSEDPDDVFLKWWNPLDIEIIPDVVTKRCSYIWNIAPEDRKAIKDGKSLLVLENTPWEVIQAVKNDEKLCFDKDMILHLREEAPAGYRMHGWGLSRVLLNFRQAWIVQVMRRFNEAIALDYINPFRVLTPEPKPGADASSSDPILGMDLSAFTAQVNGMLRRHRYDPATWHTLPFPIKYQALGGDAKQFAPKELLDQSETCLLDGIGVPVEMYKGTMTVQAAQIGIRLFESTWNSLPQARDKILRFTMKRLSTLLSWERLKARWRPVTLVDDADKMAAKLQLMMAKQISQGTGLSAIGESFEQEQRRMLSEQKTIATLTAEAQKEMQSEADIDALLAGAPGGEDSGAGGGGAAGQFAAGQPTQPNQPITPEELSQKAQTIAQSYVNMPDPQRRSAMIQLHKTDPVIAPMVSDMVEQLTNQMRLQGGEMLKQQQQQQAPMKTAGLLERYPPWRPRRTLR